MKKWLLLITTLALAACQTAAGIQQDFKDLNTKINKKPNTVKTLDENINQPQEAMALENPICPPILIDPRLSSLTEFYDEKKTTPETIVSSVHLVRASSDCTQGEDYLTLQIDLAFDGKLGPKARRKSGDRPFYAYPYFITVTDNQGNEIVKEHFAASMTYNAEQNTQSLVDTIRQKLPYNDDGTLPPYQIHVGFQLTESQLFYNASL